MGGFRQVAELALGESVTNMNIVYICLLMKLQTDHNICLGLHFRGFYMQTLVYKQNA